MSLLLALTTASLASITVEEAGLRIIFPNTTTQRMDFAMADFGEAKYGGTLQGDLYYPTSDLENLPAGQDAIKCFPEDCHGNGSEYGSGSGNGNRNGSGSESGRGSGIVRGSVNGSGSGSENGSVAWASRGRFPGLPSRLLGGAVLGTPARGVGPGPVRFGDGRGRGLVRWAFPWAVSLAVAVGVRVGGACAWACPSRGPRRARPRGPPCILAPIFFLTLFLLPPPPPGGAPYKPLCPCPIARHAPCPMQASMPLPYSTPQTKGSFSIMLVDRGPAGLYAPAL
eukprot:gene22585-29720_t